jgi:hypothetical protein
MKHAGEGKRCLQGFGWGPEGNIPLGRPRRRWEDNIKLGLRDIGIDGANWIRLAQGRIRRLAFVSTVMKLRVP